MEYSQEKKESTLDLVSSSESGAFALLLLYCLIYVLPLHASPATRAAPNRSRDDPAAIRARVRVVSLSTAACSLATLSLLYHDYSPWHLMGYWPLGLAEVAWALGLTALLFAAPLYERLVIDGYWQEWSHLEPLSTLWSDWPAWRNFVAGPITEECLFRSAAVPLLVIAGSSLKNIIFLSPLVFGLAHLHHFHEFRITQPRVPLTAAIVRSVFQFSYTYLFGIYATFIFLRTGSLLAIVLIHAFCNSMGLPRVWGSVEPYWLFRRNADSVVHSVRILSAVYYVLLFGGMWAWCKALYPWSESPMALVVF